MLPQLLDRVLRPLLDRVRRLSPDRAFRPSFDRVLPTLHERVLPTVRHRLLPPLRDHVLLPLIDRGRAALTGRPRVITTVILTLALAVFAGTGAIAWFSYDLTVGLPDKNALRGLGEMAQATTVFDADDKPVFTIFKEQ